MAQYQYIGKKYTTTPLVKDGEYVKVVEGEIVESELPEEFFTLNGFQKIETEPVEPTTEEEVVEKNTSKKSK